MNVTIFNRNYWVRRFDQQAEVQGYLVSGYTDFVANLHVHPGSHQVQMQPEGERGVMRLEGHGTDVLHAAEESVSHKGDLLLYQGRWYECVSAALYDHTMLSHYNYSFVIVPRDGASSVDVDNIPTEDPNGKKAGEATFTPEEDAEIQYGDMTLIKIKAGSGLAIDSEGYLSLTTEKAEEIRARLTGKGA